jgi:hypothetical protein
LLAAFLLIVLLLIAVAAVGLHSLMMAASMLA